MTDTREDRLRRWRLILGQDAQEFLDIGLNTEDLAVDHALDFLYRDPGNKKGGLGASAPGVARWLGDIRSYFPSSVVSVLQKDALERLGLRTMLLQPELLQTVEADTHLVAALISLNKIMPEKTRETARMVVKKVVDDLSRRLDEPMRQAVSGAISRSIRNNRPRHQEINWNRTILKNLKNYQHELRTIIPEQRVGFGYKRSMVRDVILCLDQSGSMASSVVYAGIFGAVMASLPALKTSVIAFDTSVVDLTDELHDPVNLLFGVQLGGGTDINRALAYCQTLVQRPQDTTLVLISDLFEGGKKDEMLARVNALMQTGVQMICLLALSDDGRPSYDHEVAASVGSLGVPVFACTPDAFPSLMAEAMRRGDLKAWAAGAGVNLVR